MERLGADVVRILVAVADPDQIELALGGFRAGELRIAGRGVGKGDRPGAKETELAEDLGVLETDVERGASTSGEPRHGAVPAAGQRAVGRVDIGDQFLGHVLFEGWRLAGLRGGGRGERQIGVVTDRKSTRLNSSHLGISYAV